MEVLAIVPARGGSKSIHRKNLIDFLGKPLLAWSVEAGRQADQVSRIIVSTEDEEMAAVARAHGADVPFLRPAALAEDHVRDLPVFEHALRWLEREEGYVPDLVVQLRPTSPIRPAGLIDEAISMLAARPDADSLRTVSISPHSPYKMWKVEGGLLEPVVDSGVPEQHDAPRQALPPVYLQNGLLDVIRTATILEHGSMSGSTILAMVLDRQLDADIDDQRSLEWAIARAQELGYGPGGAADPGVAPASDPGGVVR